MCRFLIRMKRVLHLLLPAVCFMSAACAQELPGNGRLPEDPPPGKVYQAITTGRRVAQTNTDSAIRVLQAAVRQGLQTGCYTCAEEGLVALGSVYTDKGDYDEAEKCYRQMLAYSIKTNAVLLMSCRALNNIGNTYMYKGDYERAADYYFHAAALAEKVAETDTGVADHLVRIYNNAGSALLQINQQEKALRYLNNAESLAVRLQHPYRLPSILTNKAVVYGNMGLRQQAWQYNQQAYRLTQQMQREPDMEGMFVASQFTALKGMAEVLLAENKPAQAIPYLETALRVRENINPYYISLALYSLGGAYLSLKNYRKAEHYLQSALERAAGAHAPDGLLKAHRQLAALYEQTGDYPRAFRHLQAFFHLNDSLLNKEKVTAINLLEVKYRTAEREKELTRNQLLINRQKRKLQEKNSWIIGISSGALLLTAIVGLLYSLYRSIRHRQRLQDEQMRTQQQQQEIVRLKTLMEGEEKERKRIAQDLHDGIVVQFSAAKMSFRSLSNHHGQLAASEDFRQALQQLDDATRDLRRTAHNLLPDVLLEDGLAEAVYYFCSNLKQNAGLNIDFQLYGEIPRLTPDLELSIYRIIQELVHNIIKHAAATHALVQLNYQGGLLSVTVEDNGCGVPAAIQQERQEGESRKGIGFRNICARVDALHGQIDVRRGTETGTIVYLEFDVRNSII